MLGLNEPKDQLAMENIVCWYVHMVRRESVHILCMALDSAVEGQMKNGRLKSTWKMLDEEKSMKFGLNKRYMLCRLMWMFSINHISTELR